MRRSDTRLTIRNQSDARAKLARAVSDRELHGARGSTPTGPSGRDEPAHADAIAQILRIASILRRRWLVVGVTTVLALAAAGLAITLLQPRWRASATVVLHMTGPQVLDKVKGVSEDAEARVLGYKEYYQTQRTIMQSRAVAERALAELGLAGDPVFLGIADIQSEPERLARVAEIDPVERLRELVSVEEIRNSRVVQISAEYPDPDIAADIANAVTAAYVAHVRTSRSSLGSEAKLNIEAERKKALEHLRQAEGSLEAFKKQNAITSISLADRQNVITQDVLTLSSRAMEAEADRIRLAAMLAQARSLHEKGNLAAANLLPDEKRVVFEEMRKEQLAAQAQFRAVDVEYGPKHDEHRKAKGRLELIESSIEREAKALLQSLQSQLDAAKQTERDLARSLEREHGKALQLGGLEREYRELEREATAAAEDYLLVARRDTEIAITNRVEAEGIEVLDAATPPSVPVFPRKGLLMALALVGGLSVGSLLALSIDFRDHRIRGLLDLERALAGFGLPVLGQLPVLPPDARLGAGNARAQRRQRDLYAHLFPQSLMAERCRGVRTSLAFAHPQDQPHTIMISSPSSSEGKSSIAMNLALSFCQAKKRVVLIDADMRRPRIHQVFPAPLGKEDVGLSSLLSEQAKVEDAVFSPGEDVPENLEVIVCGDIPGNPAELLDTPTIRRLLAELHERADVVIIDSPPVLPVTDPLILARQVDGVVLVTRCDQTTRGELQRALAQLSQADANILGVVLNEVDARQEGYDYNAAYYTYRAHETGTEPA
jgi:polysaccharide biosynthesis transport protein